MGGTGLHRKRILGSMYGTTGHIASPERYYIESWSLLWITKLIFHMDHEYLLTWTDPYFGNWHKVVTHTSMNLFVRGFDLCLHCCSDWQQIIPRFMGFQVSTFIRYCKADEKYICIGVQVIKVYIFIFWQNHNKLYGVTILNRIFSFSEVDVFEWLHLTQNLRKVMNKPWILALKLWVT